jgi:hypothetical protein
MISREQSIKILTEYIEKLKSMSDVEFESLVSEKQIREKYYDQEYPEFMLKGNKKLVL